MIDQLERSTRVPIAHWLCAGVMRSRPHARARCGRRPRWVVPRSSSYPPEVEKDALGGIVTQVVADQGTPWFSLRYQPSPTSLRKAGQQIMANSANDQ